mmetsp:Transcript_18671/g.21041  ORF Transcript_18671/g.21041 Transcript_18671/m.21041 type:complete len:420 (-) Transcript_18671:50-1309(-)
MKATFVNSILFFLFVSAFAEKYRIEPPLQRHYYYPEQLSPEAVNQSNNENIVEDKKSITEGRTDESPCGEEGNSHHYHPCDEDVASPEILDPISRNDVTFSPTSLPVGVPSNEPSIPVNETLSNPVTEAPSVTTTSPTTSPTTRPTTQIAEVLEETNNSPSQNPTKMPCTTSDGTFGTISDTSLMTVPISYFYEIETVTGTNQSIIDSEILPILEKAIVDDILQEIFPDRCGSTAIGKRKLRVQRRLEVIGLSMYPPDFINSDLICNMDTLSNPANECAVIDGELTLFTDDGQAVEEQPSINNLIKNNMNSGVYDSLSDKIVRLYYLDSSSESTELNSSDGENIVDGIVDIGDATVIPDRKSLKVGLFVGLGAPLLALIFGIAFRLVRKRSIPDDQTDMQSGEIQTYLDVDAHRSQSFT